MSTEFITAETKRQDKWDRRFINLAQHVAGWSKDPSTKVGAVLVDADMRILGTGYNGFARGVADTPERLNDRPTKYRYVVHAEVNAILNARQSVVGSTLYVWPTFALPNICHDCAKFAIQSGVKTIVGEYPTVEDLERAKRWQESIDDAAAMFREAGVVWRAIVREDGKSPYGFTRTFGKRETL